MSKAVKIIEQKVKNIRDNIFANQQTVARLKEDIKEYERAIEDGEADIFELQKALDILND